MASQAQHRALDGRGSEARAATRGQASGVQPLREAQVLRSIHTITAATLSQRSSTVAAQVTQAPKHAALDAQVKQLIQQQQTAAAAAEERDRAHARVVAETKTAVDSMQTALAAILARLPEATSEPSSEPPTAHTAHASLPSGSVAARCGAGDSPGDGSWARTPMHNVAKRKGWTDLAVTGDDSWDLAQRDAGTTKLTCSCVPVYAPHR